MRRVHVVTVLGFLAATVVLAMAQPIYPSGYIPFFSDCATRSLLPNIACHDGSAMYVGTTGARITVTQHGGAFDFGGTDIAGTTSYLMPSSAFATTDESTTTGAATATITHVPRAVTFHRMHCVLNATPHAGATFTYTLQIDGSNTGITCAINDASTSCTDAANTAAAAQFQTVAVQKTDSAATDGTQVGRCTVSWRF